ncbi:DUF4352 domain-containing protein [Methanococcoides methylutens]|uniref:DUF4352 domain-containing protein n=1 Tax=Methanococcoides methylutens MM1 TaxID=1434104 RepID=A0A0E3ST16_METMT|nr:DUF4352 domain-containing protein [Methanococcoides methylutens]AKB85843.1 hypothetical protein MCMEM_1790 [Methanococcoides methylutens MM1]
MKLFYKLITVLLILVSMTAIGCTDVAGNNPIEESVSDTEPTNICTYDWELETTDRIGYDFYAPIGYKYAIVNLYIQNNADTPISTDPNNWIFVGNSVAYTHDSATYADEIAHQSVDILPGGEFTTKIVYLVDDDISTSEMSYSDTQIQLKKSDYFDKLRAENKQQTEEEVYAAIAADLRSAGYNVVSVDIRDEALEVNNRFGTYKTMVFTIPTEEDAKHILDMSGMYIDSADAFMTVAEEDTSSELYSEYFVSKNDVYAYKHHTVTYENIEICTYRKAPLDQEDFLQLFE